uniref:C3HC4 type zinc finger protein n=1 Tax=Mimivirus LCMiAC01 TaxID=2506608 RepID=A0A481Z154_9VIRU|nr:MAG: C3HC4 type zinc finger protein [Mimivirus LCMiAC01]
MSNQQNTTNIDNMDDNVMEDDIIMEDAEDNIWIDEDEPIPNKIDHDDDNYDDDDEERVIEHLTQIYSLSIVTGNTIPDKIVENMRAIYLKNIEEPNWKDFFNKLGEKIKNKLEDDMMVDEESLTCSPYSISMDGKTYELTKSVIIIGRYKECDIIIPQKNHNSSRVHAVVFVQPNRVIVIDPGSFIGIKTMRRSENKPLEHSIPRNRKPLVFSRTERFILNFGVPISFLPKICIVCMDRPREILEKCNHFLLCGRCHDKWRREGGTCPICRAIMENGRVTHEFQTCIIQKFD